jgi:hypothetical protein
VKKYILLIALLSLSVFGRSDALVVGVSDYKSSEINNLKGVKFDVTNIKSVLHTLNISENNIKTLTKKRATLNNLRNAFRAYINNSKKNNRKNLFVFYFSGHGMQVTDISGDESDGLDEASVLYDAKVTKGSISGGILLDDELYTWLSKIKSKKVLIFDKCHSDSSYRGIGIGYEKVLKGEFKLSTRFVNQMKALPKVENALTDITILSATTSKEVAEDSPLGGLFTQSLLQGIVYKKAKNGKRKITLGALEDFCNSSVYSIAKRIRKDFSNASKIKGAFHPQFRPNKKRSLTLKNIFNINQYQTISSKKRKDEKNKREEPISRYLLESTLDTLSNERIIQSKPVNNIRKYREGESISIRFKSTTSGYLNVIVARKNSYTLFTSKALRIDRNQKYTFPESFYKNQALRAKRPLGITKVYLILSRKPWNVGKNMMALKSNDLETTYNFTKELVPSMEVSYNQKERREELKQVKPNILGISRVKFNVIRE